MYHLLSTYLGPVNAVVLIMDALFHKWWTGERRSVSLNPSAIGDRFCPAAVLSIPAAFSFHILFISFYISHFKSYLCWSEVWRLFLHSAALHLTSNRGAFPTPHVCLRLLLGALCLCSRQFSLPSKFLTLQQGSCCLLQASLDLSPELQLGPEHLDGNKEGSPCPGAYREDKQ